MPAATFYDANIESKVHAVLEMCGVDAQIMMRSLGPTRSLISGSVPVAVLKNMSFTPNDVDIYVPESQEGAMDAVVRDELDFKQVQVLNGSYPEQAGIRKILWYTKGTFKINIIVAAGENAAMPIFKFYATIVMNILHFNGLLVIYPDLSTKSIGLVKSACVMNPLTFYKTMGCINRYRGRGITFETKLNNIPAHTGHDCGVDPNCPATVRTLHDGQGQFYPLKWHKDNDQIEGSAYDSFDGMHSVAWCLGGATCGLGEKFAESFVASMDMQPKLVGAHGMDE
ncbi:hypothetical protein C8R43DRAFT_1120229 [Mycena crocata]|nr:hypothetical protein C8R43DRAFT_1120229 [Mycena crocata]